MHFFLSYNNFGNSFCENAALEVMNSTKKELSNLVKSFDHDAISWVNHRSPFIDIYEVPRSWDWIGKIICPLRFSEKIKKNENFLLFLDFLNFFCIIIDSSVPPQKKILSAPQFLFENFSIKHWIYDDPNYSQETKTDCFWRFLTWIYSR